MLPAFISEHHHPSNKDNLSPVDTVIEIPHMLLYRTQGTVETSAWQLGSAIAEKFPLILQ
jgi:hypothetical protein